MTDLVEKFDHPSWFTIGGTVAGYGIILVVMFVLLFVVPFLIFTAL
ncbi:hypothetical protein [Halorientalis sp. IM1011]|nr:hypothetical protein [Halorientalis sp. IM1011]